MQNNPAADQTTAPFPDLIWYSCDSMMIIDEHRTIVALNPAMEQLVGRLEKEWVGRQQCQALFGCRNLDENHLPINEATCPGLKSMTCSEPVRGAEYSIHCADGKTRIVQSSYTPIQLPDRPVMALVIMRDITDKKSRELAAARQSKLDSITGLDNRNSLQEILPEELQRAKRYGRSLAVIMLDLDGFKQFNDLYGHLAGDEVLEAAGTILKTGRRAGDFIARYGGDEFTMVLPETNRLGAISAADRARRKITLFPFKHYATAGGPSAPLEISASAGVALFPGDGDSPEALLAAADKRLYEAKRNGKNQVVGPAVSETEVF